MDKALSVQDLFQGFPKVLFMRIEPKNSWVMPLRAQGMDPTKVKKAFAFEGIREL